LDPAPTVTILGIEAAELERLVQDLRAGTPLSVVGKALDDGSLAEAMKDAEIVIHATPVGMAPAVDATVVPEELIRPDQVIFDVVYTPLETRLLREAASVGATTVPGLGMFVHQAAIQFELWTGRDAPVDLMTRTVLDALKAKK
jgi:shikimate dehydrogenase